MLIYLINLSVANILCGYTFRGTGRCISLSNRCAFWDILLVIWMVSSLLSLWSAESIQNPFVSWGNLQWNFYKSALHRSIFKAICSWNLVHSHIAFVKSKFEIHLTLPVPIPDEEKKLTQFFIFSLLCGASKGFMKAIKVFIKLFEAPQRIVKIKI